MGINFEKNNVKINCLGGCKRKDVIKAAGLKMSDLSDYTINKSPRHCDIGCSLKEYSKAKGIPVKYLKDEFKAKNGKYKGNPCVLLPYSDDNGEKVCTRNRTALTGDNKFKWNTGAILCLYCLWLLKNCIKNFVFLVEGESDCQTLWYKGFPALGVPGANNFKDERDSQHFEKFETIYFVYEPDKGGETLLKKLKESSIAEKILVICFKNHKDVSGLYLADPKKVKNKLKKAMKKAVPITKFADNLNRKRREELFKECQKIAKNKNILNLFYKVLQRCGVVGEKKYVKIVYLCLITRFFDKLVSILVRGASSSGKSFTIQKILEHFFPESACYAMTSMSPKALIYMEEDLKNRFIWIFESSGINNSYLEYLLRSLLSEGCIKYKVTEKNSDGQYIARPIYKEGPTGLIVTTTKIKYNEENENRCLTINTDDTKEQSKDIMMAIATDQNLDFDGYKWLAFQDWLYLSNHEVAIPYQQTLACLIDPDAIRIRRDFSKVLQLIKAHALIHQYTREKDSKGRIVANYKDYKIVRSLINSILSASIEMTVPKRIKETVNAVAKIAEEQDDNVTTHQVAEQLKIHRATANRRVNEALHSGYLENTDPNPNRPKQLQLGEDMPKDLKLLPSVKEIKAYIKKQKG